MKKFFMKNQYDISKQAIGFLILAMVIIDLNLFTPANANFTQRCLASIIFILGFLPTFFYIGKNESGIPFLPFFGMIYIVYYALPIFALKNYTIALISPPSDSLTKALLLAAGGLFMLLTAYYKTSGKFIGRLVPRISIYWDLPKAKFWAITLGSIGLIFSYLRLVITIPERFTQIVLFMAELSIIGIGTLFILQLQGRLNKTSKILLWVVFLPSLFLVKLGTGSIAQILLVVIFLTFTYCCFRKKIPWKPALVMILLLIFFSSVKEEFRNLAWWGASSDKSPIEKSLLFADLVFKKNNAFSRGCAVAAERTSHTLLSFAHVVGLTPEIVPYWRGNSYYALLWAPIPRVIFPLKPTITLGQDFGHRYGFLYPTDYSTSWNLPQLVEMYANFGVIGVLFGMFIMGIIYRMLYEMFCHPKAGEGGLLIGLFIFTKLTNIESDFSTVFGNIAQYIILLVIVSGLMKGRAPRQ
jgi:hypothetical protein